MTSEATLPVRYVRTLYDYSAWATARVLDAAAALPSHFLTVPDVGAYGSIRDGLVHLVSAQKIYLARWQAPPPVAPPVSELDSESFADIASIRTRWEEIERATAAFVADQTDRDLERVVAYVNSRGETWAYPLWQQMLHQANHATQHRSEVAALLTRYGRSPGWLDFLVFVDEREPRPIAGPPHE